VRAECLDWLLILNRRHLERVLRIYVDHYNRKRPHRALKLQPPQPVPASHNPNHRALLPAEKLSLSPIYAKVKMRR
jgi:Integrase core domain